MAETDSSLVRQKGAGRLDVAAAPAGGSSRIL